VPTGVVGEVVTVKVELPPAATEAGTNVPLAPAGRPVTVSATVPALPTCAVVIVYVVLVLAMVVRLVGFDAIEKSATAVTTTVAVAVCVNGPSVPVMVKVVEPPSVAVVTVSVKVELAPAATEDGENAPVVPAGS